MFLVDNPKHDSAYYANVFSKIATQAYPNAGAVAIPATGTGGGNGQPIDYIISSLDDNPDPYAAKVLQALEDTPGIAHATSSSQKKVPQMDIMFDRERARALNVDIATAANAVRASFGGTQVAQFETARGVQYVQVTYPESAQTSVTQIAGIPFRTRAGALEHVGDVATLKNDPNSPLMSRTNRQTVVHVTANITDRAPQLSNVQKAFARNGSNALQSAQHRLPSRRTRAASRPASFKPFRVSVWHSSLAFTLVYLLMVASLR